MIDLIRNVPDFPKPGVLFRDISPLLADGPSFKILIEKMSGLVPYGTNKIVAIESRGFILGSAIAARLGLGLVLIRKPNKLPGSVSIASYELEYGMDTLEIQDGALTDKDYICIVDDVLATGGTAKAAERLCNDAVIMSFVFMIELSGLGGRDQLPTSISSVFKL